MIQRLKKAKENKKGFTLVELIVVLVILAILIALLVPSLTGYIKKAREKAVATEARMMLEAVQTEESDEYGSAETYAAKGATKPSTDIDKLAELEGKYESCTYKTDAQAKVTELVYTNKGQTATWNGSAWTITSAP